MKIVNKSIIEKDSCGGAHNVKHGLWAKVERGEITQYEYKQLLAKIQGFKNNVDKTKSKKDRVHKMYWLNEWRNASKKKHKDYWLNEWRNKEENKKVIKERLKKYVDVNIESKCHILNASVNTGGYGQIFFNGKLVLAHYVSWYLKYGRFPTEGVLRHKCNNRRCINVDHLKTGTQQDNMDDMVKEGRSYKPIGEKNPFSKLLWIEVNEIREKYKNGDNSFKMSKEYNVRQDTISRIVRNLTWRDNNYQKWLDNIDEQKVRQIKEVNLLKEISKIKEIPKETFKRRTFIIKMKK